jgi:hypothetical protein
MKALHLSTDEQRELCCRVIVTSAGGSCRSTDVYWRGIEADEAIGRPREFCEYTVCSRPMVSLDPSFIEARTLCKLLPPPPITRRASRRFHRLLAAIGAGASTASVAVR